MQKSLIRLFLFIVPIFLINYSTALSGELKITDTLIIKQNTDMAGHLEARDPKKTILFMHNHIADNAEFKISFNNEFFEGSSANQQITMDKKDYINSYVHGLNYVSDYKVNIETKSVNVTQDGKHAIAEEVISEEGLMLNPQRPSDEGVTFKSLTSCKKLYKLEGGVALSDKADCKTSTSKVGSV